MARPRPIILIVLDGFGIGRDRSADAIAAADMPRWRGLLARWPHAALEASNGAVGLPGKAVFAGLFEVGEKHAQVQHAIPGNLGADHFAFIDGVAEVAPVHNAAA